MHRVVRSVVRPLTLAQIFSSAAGAAGMVIGAWAMVPAVFTQFALFTLMGALVQGVSFSGLVQPALLNQRVEHKSFVPLRYVAIPAAAASVLFLIFAYALGVRSLHDLLLLSCSSAVPVYYNWIRYRAIGLNRRWVVAQADFLRLGLTLAAVTVPALAADSVGLQTYLAASTSAPILLVAIRLPRIAGWIPYRHYSRAAAWQLIDWIFGSTLTSLPLLFLGGASASPLIGGVRLAQSLLGPLNLAFAAAITNLIADGVTRSELTATDSLISRGKSLSRRLTALSLLLVVAMISFVQVTSISFRGVAIPALVVGLALVGASSVTSAGSGVHAVVLRLLGCQARVTVGRGIIATVTLGAFAVGFHWYGVDVSLVAGFMTLTLISPLVLIGLARYVYRRSTVVEDRQPLSYQRLER
jgi:hypothetical protein